MKTEAERKRKMWRYKKTKSKKGKRVADFKLGRKQGTLKIESGRKEEQEVRNENVFWYEDWKASLPKIGGRMLRYEIYVCPISINDWKYDIYVRYLSMESVILNKWKF